ncbi:lipocalin family protein [Leptospira ellisii]|uniref:Lipocalin family protein n=1 Tax=Leptospira ellisii TaxID=2023197 RepID=A0AAE4TXV2_9LEPT|nr:lipocalin-like domain-containing protein [Leptospira ellisii]MDV6237443.1 lipocalin family protein [Leptospira ellisii]
MNQGVNRLIRICFFVPFFFDLGAESRPFTFPKDHSFHSGYGVEWCYFVGILRSSEGKSYGYELSFFKGIFGKETEVFPVHFAVSDLENKNHKTAQTIERTLGGMAGYDKNGIFSGDFRLEIKGKSAFHIVAKPKNASGLSLDLTLNADPSKILLHGERGKSLKSRNNPNYYSYYYSIPRLSTKGELKVEGKKISITEGESWMDHEWSSPLGSTIKAELSDRNNAWDWICILLEDGSELTVFNFRESRNSASESFGTFRSKNGTVIRLEKEISFLHDSSFWKSARTGKKYPLYWNLRTRSSSQEAELDLRIEPFFEDQEFDSRPTTGFSYWEGAVKISGTKTGKTVRGNGYLELKGNRD